MNDNSDEMRIAEAAEEGDVDAQLLYGKMLCGLADRFVEDGHEGLDDVHVVRYRDESGEGIDWLEKAAASGNTEAAELLKGIKIGAVYLPTQGDFYYGEGMRYLKGDGVQKDLERAESLLFDAAELGCVAARREVAKLCLGLTDPAYTKGVYCTDPKHWLELAAKAGDGEAQHRLAMLECEGDFSWYPCNDESFHAGLEWLKNSASEGNVISQCQYGCVERYAEENPDDARYNFEGAYINGSKSDDPYVRAFAAMAAFELGNLCYDEGGPKCVSTPHFNEAVMWYELAVKLGDVDAADRLGEILYHEALEAFQQIDQQQGSEDDKALVKRVCEVTKIAAEAGRPCSQMRLAAMYADGMGVECDDVSAMSWLLEAERSGSAIAHECMDKILKQGMSTKDVIEACRGRIS